VSGPSMVNPDNVRKWRDDVHFDRLAATLIGIIAVLAALLAVVHTDRSLEASRANLEASRLAADITGRIGSVSIAGNLSYTSDEAVLFLAMEGTDRSIAAAGADDAGAWTVGQTMIAASQELRAALDATMGTTGGPPLDPYAAGLLATTAADFNAELAEQSRQMDVAQNAGWHDRLAFLGISLLALAGVLTGLAAVLRQSRAGWFAVGSAGIIVAVAALLAVFALL
jgi:hypothetical protein